MDNAEIDFWCWKYKLQGVLQLLSLISGYSFSAFDAETVAYQLHTTSQEREHWLAYDLSAATISLPIKLALDEDDRDIVFVKIKVTNATLEQVRFVGQIQESLNSIEIDLS